MLNLGIEKVKVLNSENETVTVFNEKDEALMPIVDKLSEGINEGIINAIVAEDIINPKTGEVICSIGDKLSDALIDKIEKRKEKIKIKKGPSLTREDIIASLRYLVNLYRGIGYIDDIDHLGNRRIKTVSELLQDQFYIGLSRMERVIRERMTIQPDVSAITPQRLDKCTAITGYY